MLLPLTTTQETPMDGERTRVRKSPRRPRLTLASVTLFGACSWWASPALAQPTGQKPPCIPAASYTLGYDCELFPLPGAAGAAAPAAAAAPAPGAAPVAAVVPAAAAASAPASSSPAETPPAATPPDSTPPPSSSSSSSPSHAPAYISFALGVGGAGMAAAFGILALKTKSTLSGECSSGNMCPSSASSNVSTLNLDEDLADVGLGVAVVGVALGAILFATEHGSSTSTGTRHVQPWVGLGSGGVRGSF
jgi:hypothetical protein